MANNKKKLLEMIFNSNVDSAKISKWQCDLLRSIEDDKDRRQMIDAFLDYMFLGEYPKALRTHEQRVMFFQLINFNKKQYENRRNSKNN